MTSLVFLIQQAAIGLYFLIGFFALRWWWRWRKAQRQYRETNFELERGLARYQVANAITAMILLVEMALIIVGIQFVVAPTLAAQQDLNQTILLQPNDGAFISPTPGIIVTGPVIDDSGVQLEPTEIGILVTPTLTPTPVGTILPNAPAPIGCDTDGARLQIPANGQLIFQPVDVVGVANTANFAFFRFELKGSSTLDNFAILQEKPFPAPEQSPLGQFVPSRYAPGEYRFRLTVFDLSNTLQAFCEVTIFISEPIPTATPLGIN